MISGRQALGSIDQTIEQGRAQIASVQDQVASSSERLIELQREQAEDYRQLARIRLGELTGVEPVGHLDDTERQVVALLEKRERAHAELLGRLDESAALRQDLEEQRRQQAASLDAAIAVVDQAEAATQGKLDADPDYVAQRERARVAERKSLHAAEKAARSEVEKDEKGQAYLSDPLFTYLWKRSYGMPAYKSGGVFRWLDGMVARLIDYADARINFARLNEIPVRLREHASLLKSAADAEFVKLKELDELARAADGIPSLEEQVAEQQQALDVIDRQIEVQAAHYQTLLEERAMFASGEDPDMRDAVDFLAREFEREALVSLRSAATQTPYPEDDVVVSRMLQRDKEQQQLSASISGLKTALSQHQNRMLELESLRADFKRQRFDRAGSVFDNDAIVPMILTEFLAGMLDSRMVWKVLKEQQRYAPHRSDPGFGSGGFGRGTVWKGGLGDLGDIIGGLGRGGPGGGGGFRTGGGF